ncbi:DDB1- and CUL4-associated factor 10 [Oncorhynchus keta]|uniref:DDB1- and CUL4-associated factor 10 n=1 Tax=Oncorhynchus keta TaxID=8018 RepID=UPI00227A4F70|nr:DDB1- and CUL4-associated factor 10 [Oncorhynchus keta]
MSSEQQSDSVDPDESQDTTSSSRVSDKEQDPQTDDSADEDKTPARPPQSSREESSLHPRSSRADSAAAQDNPRCPPNVPGASGQGRGTSMAGPGSVETSSNSLFSMLQSRTIRRGLFVDPSRDNFRTMTNLYSSMSPAADSVNLSTQTHGAVFNLEYSPDGSVLTVACEQTEVLLFDPISSKHIKTLVEAHEDCVNNIRFLDNRLFATCSDDTTIALWDLRKLNSKVCSLHGHASWVKNIEYDTNTRLLVTSGFDGNVITWDTNRFTEDGVYRVMAAPQEVLRSVTRCCESLEVGSGVCLRATPSEVRTPSPIITSHGSGGDPLPPSSPLTAQSPIITSHSSGETPFPIITSHSSGETPFPHHHGVSQLRWLSLRRGQVELLDRVSDSSKIHPHREGLSPRNSLEVLTPEIPGERDRGNCITSLQLHPKGWAALIRCSSNMDDQEWTCVYEFQDGSPTRPPVSPRCSLRLTHYIEEANVGRGYIKELCFSPDGRLICSPYGYGVRLLSFDENCMELSDCLPVLTSCLREVRSIYSHSDVVLTTKFSPTHCQLASGCLSGRVALYQPRF